MNHQKPTLIGLLLATCFVYSSSAMSESPASFSNVVLRDKDNRICTLAVPAPGKEIKYVLDQHGQGKCAPDTARSIELVNVPSATRIYIYDYLDCVLDRNRDDFFIHLITTKKRTQSSIIELEYITSFSNNMFVDPGVLLGESFAKHSESASDNASCVKIVTSAQPPSP